jgi:hypothetical protein
VSNKIAENLNVLTLQGRLQAFVMSGLPVAFFLMVKSSNPGYFNIMLMTEIGKMLLAVCLVLWLSGTFTYMQDQHSQGGLGHAGMGIVLVFLSVTVLFWRSRLSSRTAVR